MTQSIGLSGLLDRLAGTPPETADTQASFQARLCVGTMLSLLAFCCVLLTAMLWIQGPSWLSLVVAGCIVFYLGLLFVARRIESKSRLAAVLSVYLALVVGLSLSLAGGTPASVTPWVVVVPLLAGVLVGPRLSLVCFVVLALEMIALEALHARNLLLPPDPVAVTNSIGVFSTCAAALLVVVLSYVDVSARESRRQELKRALSSLEEVAAQREQVSKELLHSQNLKALGRLTAGVTHEINTPIQYVASNSAFLEKVLGDLVEVHNAARAHVLGSKQGATRSGFEELEDRVAKFDGGETLEHLPDALADVREGLARVVEVTEAMRYFVHPGEDGLQMVDLNRAIRSTVTVTRNEWRYVAELVLDLDPELPRVAVRPGEMNQVFLNLLVNAAHAIGEQKPASERGEIVVATRADDGGIAIVVSDTGPGIPEEIRSRIFEPFFTTKKLGVGTGQGLALVWSSVVERHGGTINVTSAPGCGTTFFLTLPSGALDEVASVA